MRRLRSLARAIALFLPLAATACLHDAPAGPGGGGSALRIEARLAASQVEQTIRVRAFFIHNETEARVELPVSPAEIRVDSEEDAERRVTTQLAPCFVDGAQEGEGGVYCPLGVELTLLDAEGEPIVSQTRFVEVLEGQTLVNVPAFSLTLASVSGTVRNALTGAGLGGVEVRLFAGETTTGDPLATATTSGAGAYLFTGVSPGGYTLEVRGEGLITTTTPLTVVGAEPVTTDLIAAPTLAAGQIRIVLTWGTTPSDLDSHLWGPPAANAYHLYYNAQAFPPFANLDVDDTNGQGPETVTIETVASGVHVYAVHDFSNRGSTTSAAMGASGARVQVFGQSGLLANFTVPNEPGTLWTVFTLNGTTITPVNRMTFSTTPGATPPGTSLESHAVGSRVAAPDKRPPAPR